MSVKTNAIYDSIAQRDTDAMLAWLQTRMSLLEAHRYLDQNPVCLAPVLDPSQWGTCSGRSTFEHVRDHAAMGGKRAPTELAHVLVICWHHHLDGWATSHKPVEREYLNERG